MAGDDAETVIAGQVQGGTTTDDFVVVQERQPQPTRQWKPFMRRR
jgi:hypothetical protein